MLNAIEWVQRYSRTEITYVLAGNLLSKGKAQPRLPYSGRLPSPGPVYT